MNYYNNMYGNPYQQQMKQFNQQQVQQYMPQNFTQPIIPQQSIFNKVSEIQGKPVDSIEVVKAMDIALDGSINYFPLTDNSAIVTKQIQQDGTSKIIVYKPVDIEEDSNKEKYVTESELTNAIKNIDVNAWKEENKLIKKQLKEISRDIEDLKEGK